MKKHHSKELSKTSCNHKHMQSTDWCFCFFWVKPLWPKVTSNWWSPIMRGFSPPHTGFPLESRGHAQGWNQVARGCDHNRQTAVRFQNQYSGSTFKNQIKRMGPFSKYTWKIIGLPAKPNYLLGSMPLKPKFWIRHWSCHVAHIKIKAFN